MYPACPAGGTEGGPGYEMKHLLGIAGLETNLILKLLSDAAAFRDGTFSGPTPPGGRILTLFYENSTRTMQSFHLAAQRLGLQVNDIAVARSSVQKGEGFRDTMLTVRALGYDAVVIRHPLTGAARYAAEQLDCPVINAGDGTGEHPTQALLDALTILQHKGRIEGLKVAIVGDILHSRVARSNVHLLTKLGAKVCLCGPPTMLPHPETYPGVQITADRDTALDGSDVVMVLRLQRERQDQCLINGDADYRRGWGIDVELLERRCPHALIMHPGPVNRGVELTSRVLESPRSLVSSQVRNGVAVRMAVLNWLLTEGEDVP